MRRLRHEAHAQDLLQQPAQAGGQGGLLQQSRTQDRPRPPGRLLRGHPVRPERAQIRKLCQRADPRTRQRALRRRR